MSTPHSQTGAQPSPTSKKSFVHNSISTPSQHGYSSPAPPRSIPSPAAVRKDQSGKTPLNHPTTGSSSGSKTVPGGTPMVPNLSQQGSTASPLPGAVAGATPTGLGVDLGTPGQMATPALMVPTMSELGLTMSGGAVKRNEEEERRKRMRRILNVVGRPKGRVSEEGIARMSRRVGFANDIDAEKLTAEERERRVGNRTFSIAGNITVVDVELKDQVPKNVQVHFSSALDTSGTEQVERAGRILLNDLYSNGQSGINTMLDRFAANLDCLARLDRLSSSRINCFDALTGIYTGLKQLYDQELKLARDLITSGEEGERTAEARFDVQNRRSGRPAIHDFGSLGLFTSYWSRRHPRRQSGDAMDIDETVQSQDLIGSCMVKFNIEKCLSTLYAPMRISTAWLPEDCSLEAKSEQIPWRDPDVTYLTNEGSSSDPASNEAANKILPDLRFVSKFEPPVILPWQTAVAIGGSVGVNIASAYQAPSYLSMVLGLVPSPDLPQYHSAEQTVLVRQGGTGAQLQHLYKLSITKHELGFKLEELPFSHPRQIIDLLPILRQWQCLQHLLTGCFVKAPAKPEGNREHSNPLAALLEDSDSDVEALAIETSLALTPTPTIGLTFSLGDETLYSCNIQVMHNAEISVSDAQPEIAQAADALMACQDIGVWIEWMRKRVKQQA